MKAVLTHRWNLSFEEARQLQNQLVEQLCFRELSLSSIRWIAGADVAFAKNEAFASVLLFSFPELVCVEKHYARCSISFPYVPGFLSFREGEVLLQALDHLVQEPDVILFDGQGIAHPRKFGMAAHLGLLLDKPSLGCAKSRLVGSYKEPDLEKGSLSPLIFRGEAIGAVVRTRTNVKPIFVSPGHLMSIDSAVQIALACAIKYRLPEPTRLADKGVGEYKQKILLK